MYCPKCLKSIPDERVKEISDELRHTVGNRLLEQGMCPVCGTELVNTAKAGDVAHDASRGES